MALLLVPFLALFLGVMDWSWAMYAHESIVSNATRAARWAAVRPDPATTPATLDGATQIVKFGKVCSGCAGAPFGLDSATITVARVEESFTTSDSQTVPVKRVVVTVTNYAIRHLFIGGTYNGRAVTATALWECPNDACSP